MLIVNKKIYFIINLIRYQYHYFKVNKNNFNELLSINLII